MCTGPYINYHCLACFDLLARSHTPRDIWKQKLISIPETLSLWSLKVLSIFLSLYFFLSRTFLLVLLNSLSLSLTLFLFLTLSFTHSENQESSLSFFLSFFLSLSLSRSLSYTITQWHMKAIPSLSLFRSSIPLSLYCQLHRVERALHLLLLLESFSHSFFVYPGPSLRWRKSFLEVRKEEERRKTKPKPKRRRKTVASSISSRTVAVQRLVNSSYFGGVVAQRKSKSERKRKNR